VVDNRYQRRAFNAYSDAATIQDAVIAMTMILSTPLHFFLAAGRARSDTDFSPRRSCSRGTRSLLPRLLHPGMGVNSSGANVGVDVQHGEYLIALFVAAPFLNPSCALFLLILHLVAH
jgi:hypothetical protein